MAVLELDVRGLPPPEPLVQIMHALQMLPAGDTLQVFIHREPFPLYERLHGAGYELQVTALADGSYAILISRAA